MESGSVDREIFPKDLFDNWMVNPVEINYFALVEWFRSSGQLARMTYMKRIISSAGVVVLSAVGAQAAGYTQGFGAPDMSRPWSVSASLRGFYDDNYMTAPSNSPFKRSSWGFQISPSASASYSNDQTDLGARVTFPIYYYADRINNNFDWASILDAAFNHSFSQRYSLNVTDSFAYSQEPTVLDPLGSGTPYRTDQNNIRNAGSITFNAGLTEMVSLVLGYGNNFYDYKQDASDVTSPANPIGGGSYAALLNRIEHTILVNLRWRFQPTTVGLIGYQLGIGDFTAGEPLYASGILAGVPMSDFRNYRSHTFYVGAEHTFTPDLSGSVKAGASYSDSYNMGYTTWNPYADVNLHYGFGMGSYAELGFRQFFNQTDVLAANTSASVLYASVNHHFTPQLVGSVLGSWQYQKFNGNVSPAFNYAGQSQTFWLTGVNLSYEINRYLSADVGYNFEALRADQNVAQPVRYDYNRNRVYFGLTAKY